MGKNYEVSSSSITPTLTSVSTPFADSQSGMAAGIYTNF